MRKYFSEHTYYFLAFLLLSSYYIFYGLSSLGTNDDWALQNLLVAKDVYGTLIMSYPLAYVVSNLYDLFPSIQWYSLLLSSVLLLNVYLASLYIEKNDSIILKILLFFLTALFMIYIWLNITITILTIITMTSALALVRKNLLYSFALIFLASLLRLEMMFIFLPFFLVGFFILRTNLTFEKKEIVGFIVLIALIVASIYVQKQDKAYTDWLLFNKARASTADIGWQDNKGILSKEEKIFLNGGWVQDDEILPTQKVIEASPALANVIEAKLRQFDAERFIKHYRFSYWIWLLLVVSLIVIALNIKNRKALLMVFFIAGTIALIIVRDVDRVTVPLLVMWAFILVESLRKDRIISGVFLLIFVYLFYYYSYPQFGYRYFNENNLLKDEARKLIKESQIICEPSLNYPTVWTQDSISLFRVNYLFREKSWLKMDDKEILPMILSLQDMSF